MTSCKPSDRRLTPGWILEAVREMAGGPIALDPCTEDDNPTGAFVGFTEERSGLIQSWHRWMSPLPYVGGEYVPLVWCNPPFSQLPAWVDKALSETEVPVVMLTPVDYTTAWWRRLDRGAHLRCELNRRVKCLDPETGRSMDVARCCAVWCVRLGNTGGTPYGSFKAAFEKLGRVVEL